ncbi:MAG: hypothetical protein CFH06_02022, partial [Alphaproteobacteria bacterium MarineAlpha3_Bin5]
RTRVSAVKGRRPRPLDEGDCAVLNKLPKLERQRNQDTLTKKSIIKQSLIKIYFITIIRDILDL